MYKALFVTLHLSTPHNKNWRVKSGKKEWHTEPLQDPRFEFLIFQLIVLFVKCVVHQFRRQSSVSFTLSFDIRNELVPIQCNIAISEGSKWCIYFCSCLLSLMRRTELQKREIEARSDHFSRAWMRVLESPMSVSLDYSATSQLLVKIPYHTAVS